MRILAWVFGVAISRRQGFLGYVFSRQPLDILTAGLPLHDGTDLGVARQIHHRLLARLCASSVFSRQWLCILVGALMCLPALVPFSDRTVLYPDLGGLVLLLMFVVLLVALPFILMKGVCNRAVQDEVAGVTRRCFLRDVPADAPSDLQDPWRHGWLTADSRPLSAEITEADARFRLTSARAWWWIPSIVCLCYGATTLIFGGTIGLAVSIAVAIAKLVFDRDPTAMRPMELETAEAVEAIAFVDAGGAAWAKGSERARALQVAETIREKGEPLVRLGTSTGVLAARGDFFAPSTGLPVTLSRADLRTHVLVLGGTGAGKTSGILRPVAIQVGAWEATGLLILDGKGGLPAELGSIKGMTVVDPAKMTVSLVKGLEPEMLVATIADIVEPIGGGHQDPFWRNAAQTLLRHSTVLARAAGGAFWNLQSAATLGVNQELRAAVLRGITDDCLARNPVIAAAVEYFQYDWRDMDERTRSGIATTVQTWLSVLTANSELLKWARATPEQDEVDIETVLKGGRFGLMLPAYRYANAGALVTAILKARVYAALKRRATGWNASDVPVVFVIDEVQEVATREDAAMLSIGRSLGLAVVAASQTKESIVEKLGVQTAAKWLGIYGSVIALHGHSPETDRFVAEKIGVTWKPRIENVHGMAVRTAIDAQSASGAMAATRNQKWLGLYVQPTSLLTRVLSAGMLGGIKRFLVGNSTTFFPQSRLGVHPVVAENELATLLGEPDTALAILNRGRAPRRDVIRLEPVHAGANGKSEL
jgi:type IV secretory pathway TraG/TraD family ATPase VirD4